MITKNVTISHANTSNAAHRHRSIFLYQPIQWTVYDNSHLRQLMGMFKHLHNNAIIVDGVTLNPKINPAPSKRAAGAAG